MSATGAAGVVLDGQSGEDFYTVNLGNLAGDVTVADGGTSTSDQDVLRVNGTPGDDVIFKSPGYVAWGPLVPGVPFDATPMIEAVHYAGVESKILSGGEGDDYIIDPADADTTLLEALATTRS